MDFRVPADTPTLIQNPQTLKKEPGPPMEFPIGYFETVLC